MPVMKFTLLTAMGSLPWVTGLGLVFYYVFSKKDRKFIFRFTLFALMISYAIDGLISEPLLWRIIDWVVFTVLVLVVGRLFVGQKMSRLYWVIFFMTLLEIWIPLGDLSVLSHFDIAYIGHLASQDSQVSALPVTTIPDSPHSGEQTILTLQAHKPEKKEAQTLIFTQSSQRIADSLSGWVYLQSSPVGGTFPRLSWQSGRRSNCLCDVFQESKSIDVGV